MHGPARSPPTTPATAGPDASRRGRRALLIFAAAGALLCALCGIVATIILGKFWPAAIGGLAGLGIFGAAMRPPSKFKFREDRWRLPRSRGGA